jgi:transposase-like protein
MVLFMPPIAAFLSNSVSLKMDLTPLVDRRISMDYKRQEEDGKERRTYTKVFRAEAAAPAEKREKPMSRIAADVGVNESVPHRWVRQARETAQDGLPPFPDMDGLRTSRTKVRTGPAEERSEGAAGGGVKPRFT